MAKQKETQTVSTAPELGFESDEKSLAVKNDAGLTSLLNKFEAEHSDLVQVRRELLSIPRLKLVQKGSDALNGLANLGDFACELTQENFGSSVTIIPLMIRESASLMKEGEKRPVCKTMDLIRNQDGVLCTKCPHNAYWNDWSEKEVKGIKTTSPICKNSIDVLCLVGENLKPMEVNFRKTSYGAGKALINFVANDPLKVPFGSSYTLRSKDDNKQGYNFKKIDEYIEKAPLDKEVILKVLPIAKKLAEMEKSGALEREDQTDEDVPPASEPAAADVPF